MTCKNLLVALPCDLQGFGYTREPLNKTATEIKLMKGHGAYFPTLEQGQFFFVRVSACNDCCEQMRVIAVNGDTLQVERNGSGCECISSNARVQYDYMSKEYIQAAAREIGLNVTSPLTYDCETNTLSIDCNKLATDSDCGCGGTGTGGTGGGQRGAKGDKGDAGKDGVGVASFTIDGSNTLRWTDTNGKTYTIGTLTASRGPQGEQGPQGERGERGEKGEKGDSAGNITMVDNDGEVSLNMVDGEGNTTLIGTFTPPQGVGVQSAVVQADGTLLLTLTDNSTINAGNVVGPRGLQGERGSFDMLYSQGKVYVCGPAGAAFTLNKDSNALTGTLTIPASGIWEGDNPNTGAAGVIKVVHNGGVVAIGMF